MKNLTKRERLQLADNVNLGVKLMGTIYHKIIEELADRAELDDMANLDVDKQVIEEEVLQSDEVHEILQEMVNTFWGDASDKVLCELRQAWADQKDLERTNRGIDASIKGATVRKINKNMRN